MSSLALPDSEVLLLYTLFTLYRWTEQSSKNSSSSCSTVINKQIGGKDCRGNLVLHHPLRIALYVHYLT
ncbi:unnamed protein product [Calypogeia fissa]